MLFLKEQLLYYEDDNHPTVSTTWLWEENRRILKYNPSKLNTFDDSESTCLSSINLQTFFHITRSLDERDLRQLHLFFQNAQYFA